MGSGMNIDKLTVREYKLLSCDVGIVYHLVKIREMESLGLVTNVIRRRGKRGGKLPWWEYEVTQAGKELIQSYSL